MAREASDEFHDRVAVAGLLETTVAHQLSSVPLLQLLVPPHQLIMRQLQPRACWWLGGHKSTQAVASHRLIEPAWPR